MKKTTIIAREMQNDYDSLKAAELHGWASTGSLRLADFMAVEGEARAAMWNAASTADRRGLVIQVLVEQGREFSPADVEAYVAKHDAKFLAVAEAARVAQAAAEQPIIDAMIELGLQARDYARTARVEGLAAEAKFFTREANAYARALEAWKLEGIRPERLGWGKYLLPSRNDGVPHLITLDGDWRCTCASGDEMHWAKAMVVAVEYAAAEAEAGTR